jgi:threonine aldolase
MYFGSDNWAGAHPAIAQSLVTHAGGFAAAYGTSELDRKVERLFSDIFERDVAVFFVGTGTAANSLALTAVDRPGGIAFCHREAHVAEDECGAPEYFMGGSRLYCVDGPLGRIDPANLEAAFARYEPASVHMGRPSAVTITQATEIGTVYDVEQVQQVAEIAHARGLPLHMDGARFANALVKLGVSPAEMTWKAGVDMLSFGATKNGCWCAEALVFFHPDRTADFPYMRKRAAQLFSKTRFVSAQLEAYFEDGLWLDMARNANAMAARLADAFREAPATRLAWEPQANEVFPVLKADLAAKLKQAGVVFYDWPQPHGMAPLADDETLGRFVASFATTPDDVDAVTRLLG